MTGLVFFSLCYIVFCICLIFPTPAFASVGLTIDSLFSPWLKSESESFIRYHMRRSVAACSTYCLLLMFYIVVIKYYSPGPIVIGGFLKGEFLMPFVLFFPLICLLNIYMWCKTNWANHPISENLKCFITGGCTVEDVTKNIDDEYKSVNKVIIKCGTLCQLVVTDNWIIKISPYTLDIAHQSDTTVEVKSSYSHYFIPGGGQYLQIEVRSARASTHSFQISLKSSDFKDLKERIARPVNIMADVVVHESLTDSFLKVFKENIQKNPKVPAPENVEVCVGCLAERSNVKLLTSCGDTTGPNKCTMCYCQPLWCKNCMGKWFASRQDQDKPESWLSSKCTCPMCRSTFCVLDVCPLIPRTNEDDGEE